MPLVRTNSRSVIPRTPNQERYVNMLKDPTLSVVVASGMAGSGKTLLATTIGMEMLHKGVVGKLVLTRPAVCAEEQHGFLPGDLNEKMLPWMKPLYDVMDRHDSPERLMKERRLEICPLAFMRGRTFENSWIICDEAQNCTPNQMLMVLTRLGQGSKLIITGDPSQHDRGFEENGLSDLIERIEDADYASCMIDMIELGEEDVQRHPVIPYILDLYYGV